MHHYVMQIRNIKSPFNCARSWFKCKFITRRFRLFTSQIFTKSAWKPHLNSLKVFDVSLKMLGDPKNYFGFTKDEFIPWFLRRFIRRDERWREGEERSEGEEKSPLVESVGNLTSMLSPSTEIEPRRWLVTNPGSEYVSQSSSSMTGRRGLLL